MDKKQIAGMSLASVTILTVGTQSVQAEETKTVSLEQNQEVKKEVTQSELDSSKKEYDASQSEVDNQERIVSDKKSDLETKKNDLVQKESNLEEAKKLVAEATPENIEKTKTAISENEKEITSNEKSVADKKQEVVSAEEKVRVQKEQVSLAEGEVKKAEAVVQSASEDVDRAKAILDGTGAKEIIEKAEQARLHEEASQEKVNQATSGLVTAKEADAKRQNEIDSASKAVNEKQNIYDLAKGILDASTKKAEQSAKDLEDKTILYNAIKADYDALPVFTVPSDYAKYLKQYAESQAGTPAYNEAKQKLKELYAEAVKANQFKSNVNDKKVLIDTNNLTVEQRLTLAFYAEDVINQIRKTFGTTPVLVSNGSIQLADNTTDGYVKDNWIWNQFTTLGHDNQAINQGASRLGLETSASGQLYENLAYQSGSVKSMSFDDAKKRIFNAINDFIFSDTEWLHATSVAGLGWNKGQREYLGVDLSALADTTNVHLLTVAEKYIKTSQFDKNVLENAQSLEKVTARYNELKAEFEQAKTLNEEAKSELKVASDSEKKAGLDLVSAKENLKKKEAVEILTPKAEKTLKEANETLSKAKVDNQKAQQAVKDLNADIQVKRTAYEKAKEVLAEAESNLKEKQGVLTTEKEKLAQLEVEWQGLNADLSEAEKVLLKSKLDLIDKNKTLDLLLNAPKILEEAKTVFEEASLKVKDVEAVLLVEEQKLKELELVRDQKKTVYEQLLSAYQEQEAKRLEFELEQKRQELEKQGYSVIPVFDSKGRVVDFIVLNKTVETSNQKQLPQTGTKQGLWSLIGLSVLAFVGGVKKKFE